MSIRSTTPWRQQFERIAADNRSGASDLAQNCARALIAYAEQEQPLSVEQITRDLSQAAAKVLMHHPSMAALVRILNDVLIGLTATETSRLGLDQIRRISNEHIAWVEQASSLVVERAQEVLPPQGTIATLSYSSAVAKSLLLAHQHGHKHRIVCLESRPMNEGRDLANFLGKRGLDTTLVIDAAALVVVENADAVLVGADSMTQIGVVNKIGTGLIAAGANLYKVPCCVISDTSKIWPGKISLPKFATHHPDEIWAKAPRSVKIQNIYFELTPWNRVNTIVTERGVVTSEEVIHTSAAIEIHPSIARVTGAASADDLPVFV